MTHVVAVWKEDIHTYEDTVPANWFKGNCLFWPQNLKCVDFSKKVKNLMVYGKNSGL